MSGFSFYLGTAFSLIFVIEGLIYALFPGMAQRLMAMALQMPVERLRLFGFALAVSGFSLIWLLANLGQ